MDILRQLRNKYEQIDCRDLGSRQLEQLRDGLKEVTAAEITTAADGKAFIELLRKFREAVAENDKLHGENYPLLLNSLLSVGEDGLYSNNLRFIFELIQNVDDCDYQFPDDCRLDMHFDFNNDIITLTYNEVGFTPFNVFAITGIAEAAKNVNSSKNEIGEKGIGFKSVFGVAKKVLIRSGWFSFELYKENFTIPVSAYTSTDYLPGTQMTLYVPGRAKLIYSEIKKQYCSKDALFSRNPLLFLNKLTSLRMYYDVWRSLEFKVSRSELSGKNVIETERDVLISVDLHDYDNGREVDVTEQISCTRYSYPVVFSKASCKSRYGETTKVGGDTGKSMILRVIMPNKEHIADVGAGSLYSFLPTQLKLTVPIVCHVPFKLDASREFVDPQGENQWFREASRYLSELMDFVYQDWKTIVKEDIVQYIPGIKESLFAKNNGKELCLSKRESFSGPHYLKLPLFYANDRKYHSADEIFCFDQDEHIAEPERVYALMGFRKALFLSDIPTAKFRLSVEKNINNRLFKRALSVASITADALDYLDSVEYEYSEKQIPTQDDLALTAQQIETIFKHRKLAKRLQEISCANVRNNMRIRWHIENAAERKIKEVLYEDFELSETPRQVERYMKYCGEMCFCLDIAEDCYLPFYNGAAISMNNTVASFASFCYAIDNRDTFAIRIRMREASKQLNRYVEEEIGSPSEYLRDLCNIRRTIRDSLGDRGYRNYIELILKSGTDRGRFIQEILQNADDCDYADNVTPTFTLTCRGNTVVTEYNEVGFNRANIRSITAIGESTKNKLFNGQFSAIGEKGVGFKTIFAVASKVKIRSGEYAFYLTSDEPTIPRLLKPLEQETIQGTRMEFILKNADSLPVYSEKTILELCLCLRKLKSIRIDNHSVTIEDSEDRRTITIDKRQHVFKRFTHSFAIENETALKERSTGTREVSKDQTVVCFLPEKGGLSEYPLYNGLPTKHKIKIPMAIDAPFALTTSREEIETDSSVWNNIVREEMYAAILSVIDSIKAEERSKIFRFTRFVPRFQGSVRVYVNDISDCGFLTSYDFLSILKRSKILPSFDRNVFAIPQEKTAFRYPDVANFLFSKVPKAEYAGVVPASVIDVEGTDHEAALNALECAAASFGQAFPIIEKFAERYISDVDFRPKLYEYLQNAPAEYSERLKRLAVIPVFGRLSSNVEYIRWRDDSIFVKKGASRSGSDYFVLDEKILSKSVCETIFGSNINEMNREFERTRYNEHLSAIVHDDDIGMIYRYLLSEYKSGMLQSNGSFAALNAVSEIIPLKNELGEIRYCDELFLCDQPIGYFPTKMIRQMIVHPECEGFADYMHCRELSHIHYEDISCDEKLTADDVETLLDDYFDNSEELLRGFYRDGLLSDELLCEYDLEYLAYRRVDVFDDSYEFPGEMVGDINSIRKHIKKLCQNPTAIVSVQEVRSVLKGKKSDGSTFELGYKDARGGTLERYTPEGEHNVCYCQMCRRVKEYRRIEVNNIELNPTYYFPQLRISLCLDCSVEFKDLRKNNDIRTSFEAALRNTPIPPDKDTISIQLGPDSEVIFTAKHLAEIQEILLQKQLI